jgi:2'-5' RNA ligase
MAEKYFSIPLANHPALIELQDYLKTVLPAGTRWQEPGTFHITLVYVQDDKGLDVGAIPVPTALPMFGVGAEYLSYMRTPDNEYAVVLKVDKSPQLVYLQAALFYECRTRGMVVSPFSSPGVYKPHITIGYMLTEADYIAIPQEVHLEVDRFDLTADAYTVVQSYSLLTAMPDGAAISEMARITDSLVVGEFKGSYPQIANYPEVNVAELTAGDADPMFVILPVAEDDTTSGNGRFYSREFVAELAKQMKDKRPIANLGHLSDDERATKFPLPAAHWIGAIQQGKVLWGKAYIPPGEVREMVRRMKASSAKLATSIYGTGNVEWDTKRGAWAVSADSFILESIDFAPAERAGVSSLARVPETVKEMAEDKPVTVDKNQVISELTAADVKLLPDVVRQTIISELAEVKIVAELRGIFGAEADLVKVIGEMRQTIEEQRKAALDGAIVAEVSKQVMGEATVITDRIKALRQTVVELVQRPSDAAGVEAAVKSVVERAHIQSQIKDAVITEMGPNYRNPVTKTPAGDGKGNPFFEIPTEEAKA